jgi:hypothetical protein
MKHHKRRYRGENSIVDDVAAGIDKRLIWSEPVYFVDGEEMTKEAFVKWLRSTGKTVKEIKGFLHAAHKVMMEDD